MLERGIEHHAAGNISAAERLFRQVLEIDPDHPEALHLLGVVALQNREHQKAAELIQRAIAINPGKALYHLNLGNALRALGRLRQAAESHINALRLKPKWAEAYMNLGNVFQDGQQFEDALGCYRQALSIKPGLADVHNNIANVLRHQGKFDEALAACQEALHCDPNNALAHYNFASLLSDLGYLEESLAHARRSLELQPGNADPTLFLLSLNELLQGNFARGWELYERRWGTPDHDTPNRSYKQPRWNGEKLPGGSLFLWGEQGIGDEIMFAGLVPDLLRAGHRCILECDSRLLPLFQRSFPEVAVVSRPADVTALDFSAHLPIGSLPRFFRTSHADFRAVTSPYLMADEARRQILRARYGEERPAIGLAWKTRNKKSGYRRSIALEYFAPLFAGGNIQVVNLQYGSPQELAAEAQAARTPLLIDREVDQLSDMDIFAAQIAAMDLVITIDNSTAHLAGALGVPVWLLLPFVPDWRWQLNREDSPWYPSMRLFRQQQVSEWKPVLARVQDALRQWQQDHASGPSRGNPEGR